MRAAFVSAFLVASTLIPRGAAAQANYHASPIGGRTTLVGGAGLVYANDGAAAFMNPATVTRVDDNRLAFSVNFYTLSVTHAPEWYRPGPINKSAFGDIANYSSSFTATEFNALPSSLCIFLRAGQIGFLAKNMKDPRTRQSRLGLCLATIQSDSFSYNDESYSTTTNGRITKQVQTTNDSFNRFAVGPTYAMQIDDRVSIGASFHGSLTNHHSVFNAATSTFGGVGSPITSSLFNESRGASFDFTGIVGGTYRFGRQSIAIALQPPSAHVYGVGGASQSTHDEGAFNNTQTLSANGTFTSRTPARLGLGTGIETKKGSAELDFNVYTPIGAVYEANFHGATLTSANGVVTSVPFDQTLSQRARGLVDVAFGGEYFPYPALSVLGGLSYDVSAVGQGDLHGALVNYFTAKTQSVGLSFGVGSHGAGGELLLGGQLSYTWGERLAVDAFQVPPELSATSVGSVSLLFVVAGSTSFRTIKRAVSDVGDVFESKKPASGGDGRPVQTPEKAAPAPAKKD